MPSIMKDRYGRFDEVITEKISILNQYITGISIDHHDKSKHTAVTSFALYNALKDVFSDYNDIKELLEITLDNSVISKNLLSPTLQTFEEDPARGIKPYNMERQPLGWRYEKANTTEIGYIEIPNEHITRETKYYFRITVHDINKVNLVIKDNEDREFGIITQPGEYTVETQCFNMDTCEFRLVCQLSSDEEDAMCDISELKLFNVTDRLVNYLENKIVSVVKKSILNDYATKQYVINLLTDTINSLSQNLSGEISLISNTLSEHLQAVNPHRITPDKIGAAKRIHTHTPQEVGASPSNHTHTPQEIGAATAGHSHTPQEIGAAPVNHVHDQYVLRSEILDTRHLKPCIIMDGPSYNINDGFQQADNAVVMMHTKWLNHHTKGHMDPNNGAVSCNRGTSGNPLWEGIGGSGMMEFEEGPSFQRTKINYTFFGKRDVEQIDLHIVTDLPTSLPEYVRVYRNNLLYTETMLLWEDGKASIQYTEDQMKNTDSVSIEFIDTPITNMSWGLNIQVKFRDTNGYDFAILPGVSYTYESNGVVSIADTTEKIYFNVPNMVQDHPYFVGLIYDPETLQHEVKVSALPPHYGSTNEGVQPFLYVFKNTTTDMFYGYYSITDTEGHDVSNETIHSLYTDSLYSLETPDGIHDVTIKHQFGDEEDVLLPVRKMSLVFKKTEIENIPQSILLKGTDVNGNTIEIANVVDYIPDVNNDQTYVELTLFDLPVILSGFELELTNDANIKINQMRVILNSSFYNINRYKWDDNATQKYLGVIYKRVEDNEYDVRNYPLGNTCRIPVNGLNLTENNTLYEIVNPFGTDIVDYEVLNLTPTGGGGLIDPYAVVEDITEDKITINSVSSGRFALYISRNW